MIIENAFGYLKNKFPRVHLKLQVKSVIKAICIIDACMRLCNFIIDMEKPKEQFEPTDVSELDIIGSTKRNQIRRMLADE